MGPKRRRKGKTQVGAAAGEGSAAARDEEPSVVVDVDADGGPSHVVTGEAAGGGADGGGSPGPASRAAAASATAGGGGGGGSVSGGSAPRGEVTVQSAPRAAAIVPRGPGVRAEGAVTAQSAAAPAATVQSAPGGSATGQTSLQAGTTTTAQSSPRAATTTEALEEGDLQLYKFDVDDTEKKFSSQHSFLIDTILSWKMDDILNGNLLKHQIKKIPDSFESIEHYVNIHSNLLIEETRSTLNSAILDITKSQYYHILSMQYCGLKNQYFVDIDLKMAATQCFHIAKDYDVCLLSAISPLDPKFNMSKWCLGIVNGVKKDFFYQKGFQVLISRSSDEDIQLEEMKYAIFLVNITNEMKISEVLSVAADTTKCAAIDTILNLEKRINKLCDDCPNLCDLQGLHPNCQSEEQLQIATSVISHLRCVHHKKTEMVWAPPGSGKAGMILALVEAMVYLKLRVLICMPKISNILELLLDLKESSALSNPFGSVVVLNSFRGTEKYKELVTPARRKKYKELEEAFLENKSEELYCCLTLCKPWMKQMACLLLLDGYYHTHCVQPYDCPKCRKTGLLTFAVDSFIERFDILIVHLRENLKYLVNKLSAVCILDSDSEKIEELLDTMARFEDLLHDERLTEYNIEQALELAPIHDLTSEDNGYTLAKELLESRMSCLRLIETISVSLDLPEFDEKEGYHKLCIMHSPVVITTPDCATQLHGLKMNPFDVFIIDDAGKVKEAELLVPFVAPVRHVVLFGDHCHSQPRVKSKICEEAGYGMSIFQRLQPVAYKMHMLTEQYVIHPFIMQFPSSHFYGGKIVNVPDVKSTHVPKEFGNLNLPIYMFHDIATKNEWVQKEKSLINTASIFMLLQRLCEGLKNASRRNKIRVVCLTSNEANVVRSKLRFKHEIHDIIDLQVNSIDCLQEELCDMVILSTIAEDNREVKLVQDNNINAALTISRHFYWIVGDSTTLINSEGTWKSLVINAKERNCIQRLDINALNEVELKMNDVDDATDPNGESLSKILSMPGQEFSWAGRPYKTKHILAPIRDQRGDPDTCTFQSSLGATESLMKFQKACLEPPQDFDWILSVDDLKSQYGKKLSENLVSQKKTLGSEEKSEKGCKRLQTALDIMKDTGVSGIDKSEQVQRFKISSYEYVDPKETTRVTSHLEEGSIMVGHFRLSYNYYYLKPGEVYMFDKTKPFIHPKSNLAAAHAVMMIGIGKKQTRWNEETKSPVFLRHMVMQNSEGKRFGMDGIGRIWKNSVRGLYRIQV